MEFAEVHSSVEFWEVFNRHFTEIKSYVDELDNLQTLRSKVTNLQAFVTASNSILPPYDIRRSQEELDSLNRDIAVASAKTQPEKKFSFSSRSKVKQITKGSVQQPVIDVVTSKLPGLEEISVSTKISSIIEPPPGSCTIVNKDNEMIIIPVQVVEKDSSSKISNNNIPMQLLIRDCNGCTFTLTGTVGTIRLERLDACILFFGPCSTSIYLESCSNCQIFAACHQLRIHKSILSTLYVKCNSHPIIEDCDQLKFAPYIASYEGIDEDMKACGLESAACWDNVIDFRWHRSTPSPHWSVLPIEDRITTVPDTIQGWSILNSSSSSY